MVNSCGNTLNCGNRRSHCKFSICKNFVNKVTMIRDPLKWFPSFFNWLWVQRVEEYSRKRKNPIRILAFPSSRIPYISQMEFITGEKRNTSRAVQILEESYVFWGITDYWNTTVCLFHCEIGGTQSPGDFLNVRPSSLMKNSARLEKHLPKGYHKTDIVKNVTEFILKHYLTDIELYRDRLLPLFRSRARLCNCPA